MAEECLTAAWWQSAVVYQIYPRSFADANGDGVGDLAGVTRHLDHLVWLGVDALWLSPFFRSPMHDFGYDVADYCDVDPIFGNLDDFDALVAAAHARGLKVMIDWVPAHSSIEHPWFVDARTSRQSRHRNWYTWRDAGPEGELPNNWRCAFIDAPAWTFDAGSGQYYLHSFLPEQPDLNWEEPEVEAAMHEVLRFWLERGVDGFRADVVSNIGKDPGLESVEEARAKLPPFVFRNEPATHEYLRRIRKLIDAWPGDRAIVGEIPIFDSKEVATFYGDGDELHMAFNFPPLFAPFEASAWRERIEVTIGALDPVNAWPTWVLSNHDFPRHRTRYGSEARARAAAVLLLGLRGTPFLYMGEELGLEDALVPAERVVDPGGRDGCRAPLPWSRGQDHGWGEKPWLPWPPDAAERSVEAQRDAPDSILHLYRRLLAARRASPALRLGTFAFLESPEGLLCWQRDLAGDRRTVVVNFEDREIEWSQGDRLEIEVASDARGEAQTFEHRVGPHQALILKPAGPRENERRKGTS